MENNKNTIIALILMLVVWIGFSFLNPPSPPAPTEDPVVQEQRTDSGEVFVQTTPARPAPPRPVETPEVPRNVREIKVENDKFRALFTNAGARLKSLQLKEYTETDDPNSPLITLIDVGPERLASLRTVGLDGFDLSSDVLYTVSDGGDLRLTEGEVGQLVFSTTSASGLIVEKIFKFHGESYHFDLQVRISNPVENSLRGTMILSLVQPWDDSMKGSSFEFVGPATLAGDDIETDDVDDLAKESKSYGKEVVWTAFETKYFISAVVPLENAAEQVRIEREDNLVINALESPYLTVGPNETLSINYLLYFGPRHLEILKDVNYQLAEAIEFGFFGIIAKPLRLVLNFFYSFVGNWGVAIILLTVIIKLLFWPLTQKSYSSMKSMQKLQPEMAKIREKFKNDKERLNREIMELYKKNRVNPLGGCLPMLVQIPVFFALYKVLLNDIALRHAPFMLWIDDLSAKDPYYVTPIIMGATMFIQQKMTPSTMDPTQAKMFMLMPVVFTFMFLNFPSGLVIYWLINNLLTILQQYFINRKV